MESTNFNLNKKPDEEKDSINISKKSNHQSSVFDFYFVYGYGMMACSLLLWNECNDLSKERYEINGMI